MRDLCRQNTAKIGTILRLFCLWKVREIKSLYLGISLLDILLLITEHEMHFSMLYTVKST